MDDTEVTLDRQLDLLLAPLTKHFRYPLPIPEHLVAQAQRARAGDAAALTSPTKPRNIAGASSSVARESSLLREDEASKEEVARQQRRLQEEARQRCSSSMDNLEQWQQKVERSLQQGRDSKGVLEDVLFDVRAMRAVAQSVRDQSDSVSQQASQLMMRKNKQELVHAEIQKIQDHFLHIDNLYREAENPMLSALSERFPALLQGIEKEMKYMSNCRNFKSSADYLQKLTIAQNTALSCLKGAVKLSFEEACRRTIGSDVYKKVLQCGAALPPPPPPPPPPATAAIGGSAASSPKSNTAGAADLTPLGANLVNATASSTLTTPKTAPDAAATDADGALVSFVGEPDTPFFDPLNMERSFEQSVAAVNRLFVQFLDEKATLRRIVEMQRESSTAAATLFGEPAPLYDGSTDNDPMMREILQAYTDTRVSVMGPVLRSWLKGWCLQRQVEGASSSLLALSGKAASEDHVNTSAVMSPDDRERSLANVFAVTRRTLPELTTFMCSLLGICLAAEQETLEETWMREGIMTALLPKLVTATAEECYHIFRSRLLQVDGMEELSLTIQAIQKVQLEQDTTTGQGSHNISDIWVRMVQDAQERMIFRTSVYLRQHVVQCKPTKATAAAYLAITNATATADADAAAEPPLPPCGEMGFYLVGVQSAIKLILWLYSALDFSVFAVFAEESVKASLQLIQELLKQMTQLERQDPDAVVKGLLCQLAHILFLQNELSRIDANIMVVEHSLDFTKLRQRRLAIVQSSRDSKKDVEATLVTCTDTLAQIMMAAVAQPMTGVARKTAPQVQECLQAMQRVAQKYRAMVPMYIADPQAQAEVIRPVLQRVEELTKETAAAAGGSGSGSGDGSAPVEAATPPAPTVASPAETVPVAETPQPPPPAPAAAPAMPSLPHRAPPAPSAPSSEHTPAEQVAMQAPPASGPPASNFFGAGEAV